MTRCHVRRVLPLTSPHLTPSQRGPGSVDRHAAAIRAEGVEVVRGSLGEQSIDFSEYGWFPSALPGDELSDSDDDDDGERE